MKTIRHLLLICLLVSSSGCMTTTTIESAKGRTHKNYKGEVIVDKKPQPGYYAIVPFAVVGDIVVFPVWLFSYATSSFWN